MLSRKLSPTTIPEPTDLHSAVLAFIRRGQRAQSAVDAILAARERAASHQAAAEGAPMTATAPHVAFQVWRKNRQREATATQTASRQLAAVIEWCEARGFPNSAVNIGTPPRWKTAR